MTFSTIEESTELGEPIELYTFNFGGTDIHRFTNHDVDVTFGPSLYTSESMKRTEVQASSEDEVNSLEITMPSSNVIPSRYISTVPGKRGLVTIIKTHVDELGGTEESVEIFQGFITAVNFDGQFTSKLKCKPASSVFKRPGPRFQYTSLCNHILFDARCKLNRLSFKFDGLVAASVSGTITVNGAGGFDADPDYFKGGYAEFPVGSGNDFRLILEQTGDDMRLLLPFSEAIVGQQISLFAGCSHDVDICDTKFSNVENFGGFPFVPSKNPFDGELR